MNLIYKRYLGILLTFLALGCNSAVAGAGEIFASDREAAVHFLRPLFGIMDCEAIGVVSKAEVDDHFSELFYSFGARRSFSFVQDEFEQSLLNSSKAQATSIFNMIDQDGSGSVSTSEFRHFMYRVMDLVDRDQNGEVTLEDLGSEVPEIIRAEDR